MPASFFSSRRFWITSATSALVSFMRLAKRAWILEKSLPCCCAHLADDRVHVLLRRDDDPGAAAAFGGQAFGNGLQIGHQLHVVGDVLPDLIDKEIQAEIWPADDRYSR